MSRAIAVYKYENHEIAPARIAALKGPGIEGRAREPSPAKPVLGVDAIIQTQTALPMEFALAPKCGVQSYLIDEHPIARLGNLGQRVVGFPVKAPKDAKVAVMNRASRWMLTISTGAFR